MLFLKDLKLDSDKKYSELAILIVLASVTVLSRLFVHPWNMTSLVAFALLAFSSQSSKKLSAGIVLGVFLVTDLILGFHSTMLFTYGSLGLIFLLSQNSKLSWNSSQKQVFAMSGTSSVIFFLVSNFGVWLVDGMYPMTFEGLMNCYWMGLLFIKNRFFGDILFSAVFFALAKWSVVKSEAKAIA